jgi:hypothetical protein
MKSAPNFRRWIVPGGWILTAAAAFSIGRMSSFLDEPIVPVNAAGISGTAGGPGGAGGGGAGETRVGLPTTLSGDNKSSLSVGEVTGGQPLEDWLKKLMALDDDIYRMQNFVKLFDALNNPEDIKTALKVIAANGRGRGMRFTEYSMLLQKLTQLDPKEGVAFAAAQEGGERFMATGTVLRTWAKTEPEAALAWAKENGAPKPAEGDEENRRGNDNFALASVITQLAKTSLDRAIQEASSGELGRTAGRTADALLNEAMEQRGADGAKKILDSLPEGQFRNDFIQQLASRLAKDDPAGTGAWALSMPAGDPRRRALGETVDEWMDKDPTGALAFVNKLPVGPDSDSARVEAAQKSAQKNPTEALRAISMMSDPERQARTIEIIARDLARRDVNAGTQFLMQSPLADDAKAQLAQQFAQPRGDRGGDRGDFRARFGGPGGFGGRPN